MLYLGAELALKRSGPRRVSRVRKRNIFLRNCGSGNRTEPTVSIVGEILSCRFIMSAGRVWKPGILKTVDVRVGTGVDDSGLTTNRFTDADLEDLGRSSGRTSLSRSLLGDGKVTTSLYSEFRAQLVH